MSGNIPAVSIICSAYNVGQYIERCLNSLSEQTMNDWECIIIDDGSTDKSGEIADSFAATDSRFKVIHQENAGISQARNRALNASRGRYIMFVDPDDWVEPDFVKRHYELITSTGADIVQTGFWREYDGISRPKRLFDCRTVLNGQQAMSELLLDRSVPSYLWNKIFDRKIVKANFPAGKTFEDIYALSEWFADVDKMVCEPELLYHYRIRNGSVLNSNYAENRYNYVEVCRCRADKMLSIMPEQFDRDAYNSYVYKTAIGGAKAIARFEPDRELRREYVGRISKDLSHIKVPRIGKISPKRALRAWLLKRHPGLFIRLMRAVYLVDFQMRNRNKHIYD